MGETVDLEPGPTSPADAIRLLPPDLVDYLAKLDEATTETASMAVQLLPFGSRMALRATRLATPASNDDNELRLTPLAFQVIAEAACQQQRPKFDELMHAVTAAATDQGNA